METSDKIATVHQYVEAFGVEVLGGGVASTVDEAVDLSGRLGGDAWVVKAQIHAGGRGKGGGVKVVHGAKELREAADRILGMNLVTPQTGPEGRIVRKVLIEEACDIESEYYLGIVVDRSLGLPVLMASAEGGVEIEAVAARSPEKIFRQVLDPVLGVQPFEARNVARKIGFSQDRLGKAASLIVGLGKAFLESDASLAEINPMVSTVDGRVLALDAKFDLDDNALFRHAELAAYRDRDEEDSAELRASESQLSYIKLDGNIGCMVNGAGLAMATLDIIKRFGGEPANFLDVGGGATAERVTEAFKIILEDSGVDAILVNIFGGIMRCDVIAEGIVEGAKQVELSDPLVVRLEGTNVEKGREIIEQSGLPIITADGLSEAAEQVVRAASGKV